MEYHEELCLYHLILPLLLADRDSSKLYNIFSWIPWFSIYHRNDWDSSSTGSTETTVDVTNIEYVKMVFSRFPISTITSTPSILWKTWEKETGVWRNTLRCSAVRTPNESMRSYTSLKTRELVVINAWPLRLFKNKMSTCIRTNSKEMIKLSILSISNAARKSCHTPKSRRYRFIRIRSWFRLNG